MHYQKRFLSSCDVVHSALTEITLPWQSPTTTAALTIWLKLATITFCFVLFWGRIRTCKAKCKAFSAKNSVWELLCQHRDVEIYLHFPEIGLNETETMIRNETTNNALVNSIMTNLLVCACLYAWWQANENKKISINLFISFAHESLAFCAKVGVTVCECFQCHV